MALLGNGFLKMALQPLTYVSGAASGVSYPGNLRTMFALGNRMNQSSQFGKLSSQPNGTGFSTAWIPRLKAGLLSARAHDIAISATANGLLGLPMTGIATLSVSAIDSEILPSDDSSRIRTATASFAITTNAPSGDLVAFGTGSSTLSISTNDPSLTASVGGSGSSWFSVSVGTPLLGATASSSASASFSVNAGDASILPSDSSSPARSANADFSISGTMAAYAIGSMVGSTMTESVLTADGVAQTVVSALAATAIPVDLVKVRGQTLSGHGSAIDPWGPQ